MALGCFGSTTSYCYPYNIYNLVIFLKMGLFSLNYFVRPWGWSLLGSSLPMKKKFGYKLVFGLESKFCDTYFNTQSL